MPRTGDKAFAGGKCCAIVCVHNSNQRQARGQLIGRVDILNECVSREVGACKGSAQPAASGLAANAGFSVLAQSGRKSTLIARLYGDAVDGLVALAFGQRTLQGALFGDERGKLCPGTGGGDLRGIAGGNQTVSARFDAFLAGAVYFQRPLQTLDAVIGLALCRSIFCLIA